MRKKRQNQGFSGGTDSLCRPYFLEVQDHDRYFETERK